MLRILNGRSGRVAANRRGRDFMTNGYGADSRAYWSILWIKWDYKYNLWTDTEQQKVLKVGSRWNWFNCSRDGNTQLGISCSGALDRSHGIGNGRLHIYIAYASSRAGSVQVWERSAASAVWPCAIGLPLNERIGGRQFFIVKGLLQSQILLQFHHGGCASTIATRKMDGE